LKHGDSRLCNIDILAKLLEGFEGHGMPCVTSESAEDSPMVVRFEEANESDCSLSVTVSCNKVAVHRVIGRGVIVQHYDVHDIDEGFFELLRDHYDTIKSLLKMRDKLLRTR
jgi:hypothetical protein